MASDVFGFETKVGDGFMESEFGIIIDGAGAVNLVQQWNVQYQQQLNPVYECGTSTVYWSIKHASGNLTINRIVGSGESAGKLTDLFGDICEPAAPVIKAYTGQCSGAEEVNLQITGCVLGSIGFSGNSQQAYVTEDLTAQFVGLAI